MQPRLDPRIPVFPGNPVFGNLLQVKKDRLGALEKIQRVGTVAAIHAGRRPVIVCSEPSMIQEVLVDRAYDFHKGLNYRFLTAMLGLGLVTSEDELHKKQRRLVAPALTPKRIASYAETMGAFTDRMQARWPAEGRVDIAHEMLVLTLDIVAKTLFGTSMSDDADVIEHNSMQGMVWVADEADRLFHIPLSVPLPRNARMRAAMKRLDSVIDKLIADRKAQGDQGDILSMLLAAKDEDGSSMSDRQVRDEAITMIFAGHETTANGLAWTFYLLSQHPEIDAKLKAEADAVLSGRVPALADLPRLPYALAVFKESMRLYPPVPAFARRAMKKMTIGGFDFDVNQVVMFNVYGMHRRADFYPDPEKFDPERFTPENEKKLPRHAFLPFAAGPRVCIGNHFAMMEGQLLLAHLAQNFDFTLAPDAKVVPKPMITLKPVHGIPLLYRRRKSAIAQARVSG